MPGPGGRKLGLELTVHIQDDGVADWVGDVVVWHKAGELGVEVEPCEVGDGDGIDNCLVFTSETMKG